MRVSLTLSQKPYLTPPGVHDPGLDPGQHGLPMEEVEGILRKQNRGAILELPHGCGLRNARTPIPVGLFRQSGEGAVLERSCWAGALTRLITGCPWT